MTEPSASSSSSPSPPHPPAPGPRRVVVLGAGFGGLEFLRHLEPRPDVEVVVVDRQNHHLFQPLLYQVATAGLAGPQVAQPIRQILSKRRDVRVLLEEVTGIDLENRRVTLEKPGDGHSRSLDYESLVIGLGAVTNYFGNDDWERHAPGMKTLDDAQRIRERLLSALERAESSDDPDEVRRLLTVVVIGGGATGVELAGSIAELFAFAGPDFRAIDPVDQSRIILAEGLERLLLAFDEDLSEEARKSLEERGVEVRLETMVTAVGPGWVELGDERVEAATVIWAAGVKGHPVASTTGVELTRDGRIPVEPDCRVPGHPSAFAVGDIAYLVDAAGREVPGVSPGAMQMGRYVARAVTRDLDDLPRDGLEPFEYFDKGQMATIGRSDAVAEVGGFGWSGYFAWLAWLFVHLIFLVGFRNKVVVFLQWVYSYVFYKPGARVFARPGSPDRAIAEAPDAGSDDDSDGEGSDDDGSDGDGSDGEGSGDDGSGDSGDRVDP